MGEIRVNASGTRRSTITVLLDGEIDHVATADLRAALVDVILHRKPRRLIIDLNRVTALDAAAVGALRAAQATAMDTGLTAIFRTAGSPLTRELDDDGIPHSPVRRRVAAGFGAD